MPKPRSTQISLQATPYYHCASRFGAFLCGVDPFTNISYEHRRSWVEGRILKLVQIFCIDVCAYAVKSNHYHVVLHVNKYNAGSLTTKEICHRWHSSFKGTYLSSRFLRSDPLYDAELKVVEELAETWRMRLMDLSWFMRTLNEPIAREANIEDNCTGRFWEPDADQSF